MFYSSPRLSDWPKQKADIVKKSSHSYSSCYIKPSGDYDSLTLPHCGSALAGQLSLSMAEGTRTSVHSETSC